MTGADWFNAAKGNPKYIAIGCAKLLITPIGAALGAGSTVFRSNKVYHQMHKQVQPLLLLEVLVGGLLTGYALQHLLQAFRMEIMYH